jgi:hypothetical protein
MSNYCLVKFQSKEKNDCSVTAASFALALSYERAYGLLELCGRKPKGRVPGRIFKKLGLVARPDLACLPFMEAMDSMQTGRFVVYVPGHFCAVIDGRIQDTRFDSHKHRTKMVYEVPLDNPDVLSRYPYLEKIVALDKLPDMRAINSR